MSPDLISRLNEALEGRYRIERELGAGGMATVFLARDLKHDRHVAVKAFRPEVANMLGGERFLREIEIVARIEHPHILTLIDSGDAGGILYFVMPYVSGESLRARLAKEGRLPVADVVRLMRDVADGLAEAHRHGLVHRDIKPDNVMMSGKHAVVMDFGVAKAVSTATGEHHVTTAGMTVGTPTYMSPEQAAAEPDIDHRTDIYALGVLTYELLTGKPPLRGASAAQVLAAHISTTPDPVSRHREETPPALEAVVMRCLEKERENRWQETDELLQQLESIATPSDGVPSTRVPAASKPDKRATAWAKWAGITAVVAAVGGLFIVQQRRAAATADLVAELESALESDDLDGAYSTLVASGRTLGSTALASIAEEVGASLTLTVEPAGAEVQVARVPATLDGPLPSLDLGAAPVQSRTLLSGEYRVTVVAPEHDTASFSLHLHAGETRSVLRTLVPAAWQASEMVYVEGGVVPGPLKAAYQGSAVEPFLMDRFEVTNEQFMRFVSEGGYRDADLWPDSMLMNGAWVGREDALARLVDRTGLPGPRRWSGGTFPDGRGSHPVDGVSWYEAVAFASWSGKDLPTLEQWWRAALGDGDMRFPWGDDLRNIDARSNFTGVGTTPVGRYPFGAGPFGAYDQAGNVKLAICSTHPTSSPSTRRSLARRWDSGS